MDIVYQFLLLLILAPVQAVWFLLPAYGANMAPVVFHKMKWLLVLNKPVHEPLFGASKTYRGFVAGAIVAVLIVYLQQLLYVTDLLRALYVFDYAPTSSIAVGVLFAVGALGGDLVKSYYKRRRGIKPGQPWEPWDQLDQFFGVLSMLLVLAALAYIWPLAAGSFWHIPLPPLYVLLFGLVITYLGVKRTNNAAYYLGFKNTRF